MGTIWDFQLFPARIVSVFLVMCGFSGTCDVFVHLNVSCCKFPSQPWELIPVFLLFSISCPPVSRPQRGLKSKINADTAALSRGRESSQDHEPSIVHSPTGHCRLTGYKVECFTVPRQCYVCVDFLKFNSTYYLQNNVCDTNNIVSWAYR